MTQLQPSRHFADADYKRSVHYVVVEAGVPFEAVLDPGFWAHISAKLRPFDKIEVDTDDGAWYAELKVRDAGKLYAKVAATVYVQHKDHVEVEQGSPALTDHIVKFRGPIHKWCVLRGTDVLKDQMGTKEEAYGWLGQYAKSVA